MASYSMKAKNVPILFSTTKCRDKQNIIHCGYGLPLNSHSRFMPILEVNLNNSLHTKNTRQENCD